MTALMAEAGVGRSPGFGSVSQEGEAEYTIPIVLPAGTNGMTPALSFEYRHHAQGGLLGIGWSLGGLSQISRCARTIAQDGVAAPPGMTTADRFCLDGQRLVISNHVVYETPGAEYRTEIESFARIRSFPGATNGPNYFVVEAADGRIYEYGATPDSRIDGQTGTTTAGARTWALNRIRDRAGNVIDYRYVEDRLGGGFRIASILYNSNPSAGVAASHQVAFNYENRPSNEVDTGYVAGTPVRQVLRLYRVDVLYKGAILRRHELNYEPALSAGGRSRLISVRECGAGGLDCFAPTTFKWQDGAPGFAAATAFTMTVPGPTPIPQDRLWNSADINGDGRADYIWAGGTAMSATTIRYRLGLAGGAFGPEINTGIACPLGIGVPFDGNGDGRADLLTVASNLAWTIVRGNAGGLGAPATTGIFIPQGLLDFRGVDLNGDGLGDIAWSEVSNPQVNSLLVRARYALPAGGFSAPTTLYSQWDAVAYEGAEGGQFIGRPGRRIDLDGDGAEELLMSENFSVARISDAGSGTERFDGTLSGGIAFDFNDDDCADFAYKHWSGNLRVRVSGCGLNGSTSELLGPAWTGPAELQAQDWNGDGRDDLLMRGPSNWQIALSRGDSLAPIVDTGVPHDGGATIAGADANGDSLPDLVTRASGQVRLRLKSGLKPDLMLAATDGFGVTAEFEYRPLTDASIHQRGSAAVYPEQDLQPAAQVVSLLTTTDGSGHGRKASTGFRYEGLRRHLLGRGSLGFRKQIRTELTPVQRLSTEVTLRQDFPYTRLPESIVVRQPSGKTVSVTGYQWAKLDIGTLMSARRFPYPSTVTSRRYEAGGPLDGSEIARVVRSVAAIDATSGLVTDETTTMTEVTGGANPGSSASLRSLRTNLLNDTANWCLGRPQSVQLMASHTLVGGAAIIRDASQTWDGVKCRPTQTIVEPGDSQWQVTRDLKYDVFGNLASEKVTGAAMAARSLALNWGPRGQLPIRISNPLAQLTRMTWDEASGLPSTMTDPNGMVLRWNYDTFGRLAQEIQPDGTSTLWTRESCKSGCDARAKYRLVQEDRDSAGTVRVVTRLEIDQNERGFRLRSQRPGGGTSISTVDTDDRGLISRQYLPYWEGDSPPGYWQRSVDMLGRQTAAQLFAGGNVVESSTSIQYDGHAATETDSLGHVTTGTRTAWGRLSDVVDAESGRTRYEYDAFGRLLRVRDAQNNTVATMAYNPRGMRLTHGDIDMGTWTWTRNALGETTALRDAKGQVIRFEYDPLGRVTKRTAPDGTSTWTWGKTAASRDIGRLASIAGPGYAENFGYDSIGRPTTRTIVTDASYRYDYTYNPLGLLDSITYPAAGAGSPFKIRHDYDAGRVSRIRNGNSPGESYWMLNAEDAAGNLLDESLGSAIRVVSGFTPVDGMLEYRQSVVGGATIQNLAYDWDANGNLTRRADLNRNLVEEFRYDALDRLDQSRRNGAVNLELDYDAIGNIRRKSDVCPATTACYTYHATRKHAVISAGGQSYAYDANGNMTSRGGGAIAWTSDNLPLSIAQSNGNSSQFRYGPDGNRWKQVAKHGSATETTIHAGELLEKVTRSGATTWRHYVPTPSGLAAIHLRSTDGSPSTIRYLAQDHLGSTDQILDSAGKPVVAESFAAYGRRRGISWTGAPSAAELAKIAANTRDGFTGHEHLDNLDLIHMNGRVYDPQLARFISADPYVTLPYDGQGLNRYAYVLNNPLSFTDPSGFDPPPCMESSSGHCAQVTVVGVKWADWMRYIGGGSAQIASARERDPCGQDSDALTCAMQSGRFVSPSSIVLTVGTHTDSTLSRSRALDGVQGFAAHLGNLMISSSPVAMLFDADPDFQYFDEPDSDAGRAGSQYGNVGYLVGGAAGIIRKGGSQIASGASSQIARSFQSNPKYPGVDRFKDITLKKGTIIYSGFPGQTAFYTTASALRRSGNSAEILFRGLQLRKHERLGFRTRVAAYEVMADTPAALGLAIANVDHGAGWLPQVVVPSFQSSLRFLEDIPIGP
ncbi:MAG TPA: RHS repeat-associated core domain-containing protein [Steroidobacteraceae bacterium]